MIRLADDDSIALLKAFCTAEDVMACRIGCLCESWYGIDNDALFWLQYDEQSAVTAAIAGSGSELMVYALDRAERQELKEFADMLGRGNILSNMRIDDSMQADIAVMRYTGRKLRQQQSSDYTDFPFRRIYDLLAQCRFEDFLVPAYEEFVLELSHRLRHHTAECCYIMDNDIPAVFCMTAALSETTAVIGAVCTAPAQRRKGLGTQCMEELMSVLGDRDIFIMRDRNRNEGFYCSIGFENCGMIYRK